MRSFLAILFLFCVLKSFEQGSCRCESREEKKQYRDSIDKLVSGSPCPGCGPEGSETILIYDASCKKFLYRERGSSHSTILKDLNDLKLYYKKPFRIKLVNFNRYIYNLNFSSSDVSFGSQMPALMQQYLFPASGTSQINSANTYTNGASENGGGYIYSYIGNFRANMDYLLNKTQAVILPLSAQSDISQVQLSLNNLLPTNSASEAQKNLINQQVDSFKRVSPNIVQDTNSYKGNIAAAGQKRAIVNRLIKITDSLFKMEPAHSSLAKRMLDSVNKSIAADSLLIKWADSVYITVHRLLDRLLDLGDYCNGFLDDRIKAYSLCTTQFMCCQTPQEIYAHFDSLLENVSKSIYVMKVSKLVYDSVKAIVGRSGISAMRVDIKQIAKNKPPVKSIPVKNDSVKVARG